MIAIQIPAPGELITIDKEMPTPAAGEVLLHVAYAGFCGSDLNTWRGRNGMVRYPRIPGHEIGATVAALGPDLPSECTLAVGDVVTVSPYTSCGRCASCRRGRPNACENNETLGVQRDGAMQEYISLPWQKVIPAGGITLRDCALIEPMSVGFHAVARAQVEADDVVMVIGCGMVGLGAVIAAVSRGATVIAADIDTEKLALAQQLGAIYVADTRQADALSTVPVPDVVVEAVGSTPTYRLAIEAVAFTGRVACIGYAPQDIPLTTQLIVKKELDIRGSRNATPEDFAAVIHRLRAGGLPTDKLVTAVVDPTSAAEAMKQWNDTPGKVFRILTKMP